MPVNKPASLLNYIPLCATPLSTCIALKCSYHMHIVSSSLTNHETKLINSAVLTILFSTKKGKVLKWISACKSAAGISASSTSHASSSSYALSSSDSTTKKSPKKKMVPSFTNFKLLHTCTQQFQSL